MNAMLKYMRVPAVAGDKASGHNHIVPMLIQGALIA